MSMKDVATEIRLAQWAQVMQERVASGQSIVAFCEERGIARQRYFYWQRRLRAVAADQLKQMSALSPEAQALVPSGWAQVTEEPSPAPEPQSLTLRVGGAEIEVRQGYDEALLASVCRALSSC